VKITGRRAAAVIVAAVLAAAVISDLTVRGFRDWWDSHSFTGNVVSSLLGLAVAGLIVDEVVARRQRRDRSVSVAVQGLIVYGQARRSYAAVMEIPEGDQRSGSGAREELTILANMLLTASSSLFDDPDSRVFLEKIQRLSASMYMTASASQVDTVAESRLKAEMAGVKKAVEPLIARIPSDARSSLEGQGQESP
jgi:hypothetical protein